jgi:RNA polymerase sigma-70 factor (ECF subfamily)
VNAVGADSPETADRFDRLEPTARRARISDAVNRQLAHLSDEALVALAARSEQSALAELYDRYGRTAYGLALRILRDQALAEDAVQEAFLAVWRTASRFVPERGRASTWILTLVHRRAVDAVRREQRRRADSLDPSDEPAVEGGVEEDAWLRFQRERVQDALSRLPDAQREALELAYYGGFSQSELAERLGQPLGTIKSRMFGGLSRMRELLGEPGTETSWTHTT